MNFNGVYTALVTPFTAKNQVNEEKLKELIEFQIANGVNGLVPCGTTGESPTLSWEEHLRIIELTVEAAAGRVKIIAGTGSNNTEEAVRATKSAKDVGADAALIVNPYYNKPTQEGLFLHFSKIAAEGELPVVVYNIVGRTAVNISVETMNRLADVQGIVACKEASGDISQVVAMIAECGDRMDFLSGDDAITLPMMSLGGKGVVSVIANIMPAEISNLCKLMTDGMLEEALKVHNYLLDICQTMFLETNPIPVKEALNLMGFEMGIPRLPMTPLSSANKIILEEKMNKFGLLK